METCTYDSTSTGCVVNKPWECDHMNAIAQRPTEQLMVVYEDPDEVGVAVLGDGTPFFYGRPPAIEELIRRGVLPESERVD